MSEVEEPKRTSGQSAEKEHTFHHYTGNKIPAFVHMMWVVFWIVMIFYALSWVFPTMQTELVSPP